MPTEHNVITDPEIHEPKDVSTATVNQVYVADGAGSGTWKAQTNSATNTLVRVTQKSDFPAPSGGIITLADNTTYLIDGDISIGADRIVGGIKSALIGYNPQLDKITYTSTGVQVTTSLDIGILFVTLVCTSATATHFSFSGSTDKDTLVHNVIFTGAGTLGTFSARGSTVLESIQIKDAAVAGFTFTGAHVDLRVTHSCFETWVGTVIDLGSATFTTAVIGAGNNFAVASGRTAISGQVTGGNINAGGGGIINGNIFTGVGTFLNGITKSDNEWEISSNSGVQSGSVVGGVTKDAGRTNTTLITSTAVKMAGTSTLDGESERFDDNSSENDLRYTGTRPAKLFVAGFIVGQSTIGSTVTIDIDVRINGSTLKRVVTGAVLLSTGTDSTFAFRALIQINENENMEMMLTRTSGSGDADILAYNLDAIGV